MQDLLFKAFWKQRLPLNENIPVSKKGEKIYPNIARGVRGTRKAKGFRKDCLTQGQIREALASIDGGSLKGLRDYALFNLLVRTGIRTIEVVRAQVGDLRQQGGEAVLWVQGRAEIPRTTLSF